MVADNADPATPGRLIDVARRAVGRLDGALVSVGGPPLGPVAGERVTDEQWRTSFESVFLGAVRLAREVGRRPATTAGRSRSCCRRACGRR